MLWRKRTQSDVEGLELFYIIFEQSHGGGYEGEGKNISLGSCRPLWETFVSFLVKWEARTPKCWMENSLQVGEEEATSPWQQGGMQCDRLCFSTFPSIPTAWHRVDGQHTSVK